MGRPAYWDHYRKIQTHVTTHIFTLKERKIFVQHFKDNSVRVGAGKKVKHGIIVAVILRTMLFELAQ